VPRPAGWGTMAVVGGTYLERGRPVVVLVQWRSGLRSGPTGPRNVLIRRADGTLVVRPFRGLRRPDAVTPPPAAHSRVPWRPAEPPARTPERQWRPLGRIPPQTAT
jgi:hypothetical protein